MDRKHASLRADQQQGDIPGRRTRSKDSVRGIFGAWDFVDLVSQMKIEGSSMDWKPSPVIMFLVLRCGVYDGVC